MTTRNEMATRKEMYSSFIKKQYPNVKYNSQKFKHLMSQHARIVKDIKETYSHYTEQEILDDFYNIIENLYKRTTIVATKKKTTIVATKKKTNKLKIVDTFSKLQKMNPDDENYEQLRNDIHIMAEKEIERSIV